MRSWQICSWNNLSVSTAIRCTNHISRTASLYVDWIHMLKNNTDSRHIWIASLEKWLMINYYTPRKVWKLKAPSMFSKMVPPKRMIQNIKMSLLTNLRPNDDRCCSRYLPIYLPIYSLVSNLYSIINNVVDLFIKAYFYYHVIISAIF